MLVWVPEPVCQTTSGKWSSSLTVDHLLRGLDDRACAAGIEQAERAVRLGGSALDDAERADQRARHALAADPEILDRALGLRAPVAVGRHFDRAECVGLDPAARPGASLGSILSTNRRHYFLRKRSSRTTSAPGLSPGGFGGLPDFGSAAAGRPRTGGNAGAGIGLRRLGQFLGRISSVVSWTGALTRSGFDLGVVLVRRQCQRLELQRELHRGIGEALDRLDRDVQALRHSAERQHHFKRLVGNLQIAELVLQNDGHLFGILFAQPR